MILLKTKFFLLPLRRLFNRPRIAGGIKLFFMLFTQRFQKTKATRFTRWARTGFAVYMSLRRVVTIGVLPLVYTLSTFGQRAFAQSDAPDTIAQRNIDSVLVMRERPEPYLSERLDAIHLVYPASLRLPAAPTFADLLAIAPGVEARTRGAYGAQADISIRGGSFDQCMVLLNGVDITDALTGHHNLNIPVRPEFIERVEVLTGPGARSFGAGAFSGAINIITKQASSNGFRGKLAAGQYSTFDGYAQGTVRAGIVEAAGFVAGLSTRGASVNTDQHCLDALATVSAKFGDSELSAQLGHQAKAFGAQSFYTPKFPDQYEALRTTLAALRYNYRLGGFALAAHVGYRGGQDHFKLFRGAWADWYKGHNYHHIHLVTGRLAGSFTAGPSTTTLAVNSRYDKVFTTTNGELIDKPIPVPGHAKAFYTRAAQRQTYSLSLNETLRYGIFSASLGGMATYNTVFKFAYGYGIDLGLSLPHHFGLRLAVNSALRLPTFTDLYYKQKDMVGNPLLRPESALTCEAGVTYGTPLFSASLDGYYRMGRDIIDWVQKEDNPKMWQSMNHAQVNAAGGEFSLQWAPGWMGLSLVRAVYAYNQLQSPSGVSGGSAYAFHNLAHRAQLSLICPLPLGFGARLAAEYAKRNGKYKDVLDGGRDKTFPDRYSLDLTIDYTWRSLRLFVSAQNVLGQVTIDYPHVPRPGRWVMGGVEYGI